jgi:hypothetical protein
MTTVGFAWLSTQFLKIAGQKVRAANEFPMSAARDGQASPHHRTLEPGAASMALRSVRYWPQALGPFLMMILSLRRQSSGSEYGNGGSPVLPEGALFVVRYSSR